MVSAGALHAQGWGFESLIAHHLAETAPGAGPCPVRARRTGIRTHEGGTRSVPGGGGRRPPEPGRLPQAGAESLIAHHLVETAPGAGPSSCLCPPPGIRTREGGTRTEKCSRNSNRRRFKATLQHSESSVAPYRLPEPNKPTPYGVSIQQVDRPLSAGKSIYAKTDPLGKVRMTPRQSSSGSKPRRCGAPAKTNPAVLPPATNVAPRPKGVNESACAAPLSHKRFFQLPNPR